jgi:uncharacterized RDD family membrane protein YckC
MAEGRYRCSICGVAGVPVPGRVCPLHLRASEQRLLAGQAQKPSAWVLGAGDEAAVRPLPPAVRKVGAPAEPAALELASFSQRLFALLVDLPIAAMMALFLAALGSASPIAATVMGLAGFFSYFLLSNSVGEMAGKAALGIRVIDPATGREPGFGKGALRTVGMALNLFTTFGFGFLMALWDRRRMTIHDYAAGTIVVRATGVRR